MARIAMLLANGFTHHAPTARAAGTLGAAGHDVVVHAVAGPGLPREADGDGFRIRRHDAPGWTTWTGPPRIVPLLRWYERSTFLARAAAQDRPDVVHGHDLETLHPASRLAGRLGVPHVHQDHELGLDKLEQGMADWLRGPKRTAMEAITRHLRRRGGRLEARLIPRAAALITASPGYADVLLKRYGIEPVVLLNTPPRTDPEPTPLLRERAGLPADARVVLYQGTVTPSGGADDAIEAAATFPEGWFLVFLGTTWMRPRLEALVRERGLGDRVRFLDSVPHDELPAWTRAADVGISPLRPANPGQALSLANKIFEYLQAGLPLIVSDMPGQGALVREVRAGEILPEVSATAISAAVGRLARLPEQDFEALSDRLRRTAHERYCWEIEREKLLAVYERVLAR